MIDIASDIVRDIETKTAARRVVKSEPTLVRDILPKVMRDIRLRIAAQRQFRIRAAAGCCAPGQMPAAALETVAGSAV